MNTKKIVTLSVLVAVASVLSYLESLLPGFIPVPGVKVGLANIAVVFALYALDGKSAALISLFRVLLLSLLFGNAAGFLYSVGGAVLSLSGMLLLKRFRVFDTVGVSIAGGVLHNLGQIAVAAALLRSPALITYFPVLLLFGTAAGCVVGIVGGLLVKKVKL